MAKEINTINDLIEEIIELLKMIDQSQKVLFCASFRRNLSEVIQDTVERLSEFNEQNDFRFSENKNLYDAGLNGIHLTVKLDSFESSLQSFRDTAREDKLDEALDKGRIILGSLAGAIPGLGSFAQELIDFLLKELRRRIFGRN